jgi:hypothetical protein
MAAHAALKGDVEKSKAWPVGPIYEIQEPDLKGRWRWRAEILLPA